MVGRWKNVFAALYVATILCVMAGCAGASGAVPTDRDRAVVASELSRVSVELDRTAIHTWRPLSERDVKVPKQPDTIPIAIVKTANTANVPIMEIANGSCSGGACSSSGGDGDDERRFPVIRAVATAPVRVFQRWRPLRRVGGFLFGRR